MPADELLPLVLLYLRGGSIDSVTRIQKLTFLLQRETDCGQIFDFRPGEHGPISIELAVAMEEFEERGLVEEVEGTQSRGERSVFCLTPSGYDVVREIADREASQGLFENGRQLYQRHGEKPLDVLVRYVSREYPDMITAAELDIEGLPDG